MIGTNILDEIVRVLPANWSFLPLKRIAAIRYGLGQPPPTMEGGVPLLRATNVTRGLITDAGLVFVDPAGIPSGRDARLRAGEIIVVRSGAYTGDSAIVPDRFDNAVTGYDMVVRARYIDSRFLAWQLLSSHIGYQFSLVKSRAAQPHLNAEDLGEILIAMPSSLVQTMIADFIDRETAKIDALILKQTEFLIRLDEHRRALITEAVTRGLDPNVAMRDTGLPTFPQIPKHWTMKPLKILVRSDASITYGIVQAGPHIPDGIPYIRTSDMSGSVLPETGYLRTSPEIAASYARSRVQSGDVVIAIRATVGKSLIVPQFLDGANLTQGTARISPGTSISAEYLCYVLNSSSASQGFDAIAKGATFKEITLEMLRNFRVPVPPCDEQAAILLFLRQRSLRLEGMRDTAMGMIACFRERRAALITAAVTGQIDVTEPALTEAAD
jgi:type I restriction enzyme, S subunit